MSVSLLFALAATSGLLSMRPREHGYPLQQEPTEAPAVVLRAQRVFDGTTEHAREGWEVLVRAGRIEAVGSAEAIRTPAGTRTIDLPGMTLLPGLIDAHTHVFLHPYNETGWNDQVLKEPLAYRAIQAVRHAEWTLMSGFTAVRDLGTEGARYADLSLKRAVIEGKIPGPRLIVSTLAIAATRVTVRVLAGSLRSSTHPGERRRLPGKRMFGGRSGSRWVTELTG